MPKVVFLQAVAGVAQEGDIKEVKNGYASNFLFPKKLARIVKRGEEKTLLEKMKAKEVKKEKVQLKKHEIGELLNGKVLNFELKASSKGKVYAGVSEKDVVTKIKEEFKIDLEKKFVDLGPEGHIKMVGERDIYIKLADDVFIKMTVVLEEKKD